MNFKWKMTWLVGIAVLSLLLTLTDSAWAAPPAPAGQAGQRQPGVVGQVTSIYGTTITLDTPRGELVILVAEETRYRVPGNDEATLDGLHPGDWIAVRGKRQEERVLSADVILVIPERAALLRGSVREIVDQVLTLVVGDDEITVLTDTNTRVFVAGIEDPNLQDLEPGSRVAVFGQKQDDGEWLAHAIRGLLGQRLALVRGEVTKASADSFQIDTARGELAVHVDDRTCYRFPDDGDAGLGAVTVGAKAVIAGLRREDGGVQARVVGSLPEDPRPRRVVGVIEEIAGAVLDLTLSSGMRVDILTDENTQVLVPGRLAATIADLESGDTVAVLGRRPGDGEIPYAVVVAVLRDALGRPAGFLGKLTNIAGNTLTVQTRLQDEVFVLTDSNTQFFVPGVDGGSIDDLKAGDLIGAQVVERDDGTLYASAVGKSRPRPRRDRAAAIGRVDGIVGKDIRLATRRGQITLLTDERTRFRLGGAVESLPGGSLNDVEIGQIIGAVGHWEEDGSFHARIVGAHRARPAPP